MTSETIDTQNYTVRDRGTGVHTAHDVKSAFASVPAQAKRKAYFMLGAAGVTVAFLLLTRLFWLFEPLLDKILYGTLSELIYYVFLAAACTGFVIGLNKFIKCKCAVALFAKKDQSAGLWRSLSVIGVAALFVFVVSAILGFKLKIQSEMGIGVTLAAALTNICVYFYYALHMWLGFCAAALVQYGLSTLLPTKYTIPWGSIFLVTVFGLLEFVLEQFATTHIYCGYYYLFTYAYAIIFTLSARSFHVSYWASVVIMIL